ncbi:MAG: uroporphyrinogen decarboxylase [Hyphomicrobiales bacterium]|nr:uroporphyrinogen decarboxylase [Hyphomicrobiales bacterium]MDE2114125.1 uroporphyrinogen decarboxylase [Hyphomicrobiales bacterium]
MMSDKRLLQVLQGKALSRPPVWLMRQAGRYLSEYREIRATAPSFIDFCYTPKLAAEATLQPIRRFGFDAAILFSDILVIADALGQKVSFETGEGPRLDPVQNMTELNALHEAVDLARLNPVFETIDLVRKSLPSQTGFIGFCGAPWTVASYMVAGHGTPDQAPARLVAYRDPVFFQALIDRLVKASIVYLSRQVEAGIEAVQIFDSWAGVLPKHEFERWCVVPVQQIIQGLKALHPTVPVIAFPRGAGGRIGELASSLGAEAIGLDTAVDPYWARDQIDGKIAVQGNLDPLVLLAGGAALDRAVDTILEAFSGRPHIFNLGHGILPPTPIAHVEQLMKRLYRN